MDEPEIGRARPGERVGKVIMRWPYRVLVGTILCLLIVWDATRNYADETKLTSRSWLDWVVLALIVYGIASVLVIVPRIMVPRSPDASPASVAYLRWALAMTPAFLGSTAVWMGGSLWVATLGLGVSIVLLVILSRNSAAQRI